LAWLGRVEDEEKGGMRIVAITNSRIPSLTANSLQAMKVCDALTQLGHAVTLIAPAEADPAEWDALAMHYGLEHRFEVHWWPSRRLLRRLDFVWYAQTDARHLKPDIIYTWLPQSAAFASRYWYPVILEMHANVTGSFGAWWLRRFWSGGKRKRMLVTTRALKTALERSTGLSFLEPDVQIAPNGVDLNRYADLPSAADSRRALGLPDCSTAGFTGHFYRGRGMEVLHHLARALPKVSFLWIGGTPEAVNEWRVKLQSTGVTNVTLTGFVENSELPRFQAAADVLLMPYSSSISSSSGQEIAEVINPMKMFEYMAAERAILTADLPSIREVLDDTCAVFCAPGDAAAWKVALEALLSDETRRVQLAHTARRVAEKHTWLARAEKALAGLL
jgi:glycosyltransferase involved in cell wall biosynthesis